MRINTGLKVLVLCLMLGQSVQALGNDEESQGWFSKLTTQVLKFFSNVEKAMPEWGDVRSEVSYYQYKKYILDHINQVETNNPKSTETSYTTDFKDNILEISLMQLAQTYGNSIHPHSYQGQMAPREENPFRDLSPYSNFIQKLHIGITPDNFVLTAIEELRKLSLAQQLQLYVPY